MNMPVSGGQARVHRTRRVRAATKAPSVSVAAAVAGILCSVGAPVHAQEVAEATNDNLAEVVVTANASSGIRKIDASYNIVSVSLDQIKQANPQSTAEVFKLSPGVWPESSGGQTGANIERAVAVDP